MADVKDFGIGEKYKGEKERDALVFMARLSEQSERYDDMAALMKRLVKWTSENQEDLTVEERNLLSVAYKNVIGVRRASWRTLNEPVENNDQFTDMVQVFLKRVEVELEDVCKEVVDLLENYLVKNAEANKACAESKVFYLKMLGDYWRYRAEYKAETEFNGRTSPQWADHYYREAFELAKLKLEPTHPIRLGLALNYSVCYYEILKEKSKACDLAKEAFDQAISKLDTLKEEDYKDSTLIMQLLRDNLTLWTSEQNSEETIDVQDVNDDEQ